jgi:hypothetical protein
MENRDVEKMRNIFETNLSQLGCYCLNNNGYSIGIPRISQALFTQLFIFFYNAKIIDMKAQELAREYIQIKDDNGKVIGCGFNQSWLSNTDLKGLSNQCCGMISAIDCGLYLANKTSISKHDYLQLCRTFSNTIVFTKLFTKEFFGTISIGILPFQICRYINSMRSIHMKAKWNGIHGHRNMLSTMEEMLGNNIPVIWGLYRYNHRITLYSYDSINDAYKATASTNSHYVNAIAIIHNDTQIHNTMIKVSSWGQIFYIDYDEYLAYVGKSIISKFCSNIVVIN